MADKKLNEVTKVTDMAYVPVIMSDGSIGQIAKADLATVVAGLIGSGYKNQGGFTDANDCGTYGYYYQNVEEANNTPSTNRMYSTIIVLRTAWAVMQFYLHIENGSVHLRYKDNQGKWSIWKQLMP